MQWQGEAERKRDRRKQAEMGKWRERVRQAPRETKDKHTGAHTHTHTNHFCCPLQCSREAVLCICVCAEGVLGELVPAPSVITTRVPMAVWDLQGVGMGAVGVQT